MQLSRTEAELLAAAIDWVSESGEWGDWMQDLHDRRGFNSNVIATTLNRVAAHAGTNDRLSPDDCEP